MTPQEQLVSFIKDQLSQGKSVEFIKDLIKVQGWTDAEIDQSIFNAQGGLPAPVDPTVSAPVVPSFSNSVPPPSLQSTPQQPAEATTLGYSAPEQQAPQVVKKSITKKFVLIIVILLVLAGVSYGGYFGYSYFKKGKLTLSSAVLNTIEATLGNKIKSGEFSVMAEITAKDVGNNYSRLATDPTSQQITGTLEDVSLKLDYSGIINTNESNKVETSGNLSASVKNPNGGSLGMFGSQEFDLEYKVFSDNMYLNIKKIPSIATMIIPQGIDVKKYLNQWFFVPASMAKMAASSVTGGYSEEISTSTLPLEAKEYIIEILDGSGAFTILDKKSEEIENGTKVTALYIKVDLDKFGDELIKFNKKMSKEAGVSTLKSNDLEIKTQIEKLKELPVENNVFKIFVGESDGYIYGFSLTGDLMDMKAVKIGRYNIKSLGYNFNKGSKIEKPENARSLMEVMIEISQAMYIVTNEQSKDNFPLFATPPSSLSLARGKGMNAAIKSNLSNLRAEAEMWYDAKNNTYLGVCTSPRFKEASKAINSDIICREAYNSWSASAALSVPEGGNGFYCVGSSGAAKLTNTEVKLPSSCR